MSTKEIASFKITEDSESLVVNHPRSSKDWFDLVVANVIGLSLAAITGYIISYAFHEPSFIASIIALIFCLGTIVKLIDGISRLVEARKNVITIDKKKGTIAIRNSIFTSTSIPTDNIIQLLVQGHKESLHYTNGTNSMRFFCKINILLKDQSELTLLTVNTERFLRPSDQKMETELYAISRNLAIILSQCMSKKYQWLGFKTS